MGARDLAARQFKPKAVSAFYDHDRLKVAIADPWAKRDEVLPLPLDTHSIVQIVGSFGVGKTTLIRQMLGTSPDTERFPSTSKGVEVGYDGGALHYFCSLDLATLLESTGFSIVQAKGVHYRPLFLGSHPTRLPFVSSILREFFAGEIMIEAVKR